MYFIIIISGFNASCLHGPCDIINLREVLSLNPWSNCSTRFVAYNGFLLDTQFKVPVNQEWSNCIFTYKKYMPRYNFIADALMLCPYSSPSFLPCLSAPGPSSIGGTLVAKSPMGGITKDSTVLPRNSTQAQVPVVHKVTRFITCHSSAHLSPHSSITLLFWHHLSL